MNHTVRLRILIPPVWIVTVKCVPYAAVCIAHLSLSGITSSAYRLTALSQCCRETYHLLGDRGHRFHETRAVEGDKKTELALLCLLYHYHPPPKHF